MMLDSETAELYQDIIVRRLSQKSVQIQLCFKLKTRSTKHILTKLL